MLDLAPELEALHDKGVLDLVRVGEEGPAATGADGEAGLVRLVVRVKVHPQVLDHAVNLRGGGADMAGVRERGGERCRGRGAFDLDTAESFAVLVL